MDQETCEAKGWIWNEKKKTCTQPRIGIVAFKIPRGAGCDGTETRETHGDKLKPATHLDLLATGKRKRGPRRRRPADYR